MRRFEAMEGYCQVRPEHRSIIQGQISGQTAGRVDSHAYPPERLTVPGQTGRFPLKRPVQSGPEQRIDNQLVILETTLRQLMRLDGSTRV